MNCWNCSKKHNCWDDKYIEFEVLDIGCEKFEQEERVKEQNMRNDGLTIQEGFVMDHLVEAWNHFVNLEKQHPSEVNDFADGIHKCQQQLAMRVLRRDYPDGYPTCK